MVTAVICMSLRRYVFKSHWKLTFEGKGLTYFGNMYRANSVWFSWTVKHSMFIVNTISRISHLCLSLSGFRHSAPPLLRKSYIFVRRGRFLPTICRIRLCMSIFQCSFCRVWDAPVKRKPIYVYYLFLADSMNHMLGNCQKEVNYHLIWSSCDSWRS